jgi:hypothetical protein
MEDVKAEVSRNQDVLTVSMEALRNAYGAGRLGIHVRDGISKELHGLGVGHYPTELPDSQDESVRLYKHGTPVADVIDAVLQPGEQHDEEIREAAAKETAEVLKQIRELICR